MNYKEGDLFIIIAGVDMHDFEMDEIVTFTGEYDEEFDIFEMINWDGVKQWLEASEFKPYNPLDVLKDIFINSVEITQSNNGNTNKTYKKEEVEMNYEKGDLFKLVSEIPSNKLLKKGQIVELVSKGTDLFTIKDAGGKWHYVPIKFLEYYDEVAQAPLDKNIENEIVHIMDFHKENYINKCLEEGNFEALEKL